jgi:hypothetical protein
VGDLAAAVNGYLLKVRFKRWGKLWTPGTLNLLTIAMAAKQEARDHRIETVLYQIPLPEPLKRSAVTKRYSYKKRRAMRQPGPGMATSFMPECVNPAGRPISLTLTLRSMHGDLLLSYQKQLILAPGFSRTRELFEVKRVQCTFLGLNATFGVSPFVLTVCGIIGWSAQTLAFRVFYSQLTLKTKLCLSRGPDA